MLSCLHRDLMKRTPKTVNNNVKQDVTITTASNIIPDEVMQMVRNIHASPKDHLP
jgi:hypothetical protein